jgi:hypothetical protein
MAAAVFSPWPPKAWRAPPGAPKPAWPAPDPRLPVPQPPFGPPRARPPAPPLSQPPIHPTSSPSRATSRVDQPATDPTRFEPVPSGRYDILFTLYAAPVGGESKVWGPERHAQVTVVNGLVNALLGSVLGFEDTLASQPNFFRRPLYVGITIDADGNPNTADLELVPRQVLLPAVQALNANTLDGADWRTFFIGTDADATFTPGVTKARDADLFDGIDSAAVFVDPSNTSSPKVKTARLADAISGALTVEGLLKSVFFMVPKGAIIMWSGNALPNGWALCNGQNGTPDLRNKFVRGAPGLGPYASGGSDTHAHTSPAHLHSVDPPARPRQQLRRRFHRRQRLRVATGKQTYPHAHRRHTGV